MPSEPGPPNNIPSPILDGDLDPHDPFYELLLANPDLPRLRCSPLNTKYTIKHWGGSSELVEFDSVLAWLQSDYAQLTGGVIVIEEIDDIMIFVLEEMFSSIDHACLRFLHQHVARLDTTQHHGADLQLYQINRISTEVEDMNGDPYGLHFDGICCPIPSTASRLAPRGGLKLALSFNTNHVLPGQRYRTEAFISDGSSWRRASTRISCCKLRTNLGLVLVDAPFSIPAVDTSRITGSPNNLVLPGCPYDRPGLPNWDMFDPWRTLQRTFVNFAIQDVLDFMSQKPAEVTRNTSLFHCLLTVSEWQSIIDQLEPDLRRLQSQATNSLEKSTLNALGLFRRDLADSRESIADNETQMLLATGMTTLRSVGGQKSRSRHSIQYNFNGDTRISVQDHAKFHIGNKNEETATEAIDAATLLDKLANLEERLIVISKTVNEEIQLFIASISIRDSETMMADSKIMREDSKVMREDSQIMKQQAACTTLLTTLAVIYLPLQLITGIFGMNIKEITGDGGPRWWACLIALGVGGALTFLVYLGVKWWQWRDSLRKKRDGKKDKGGLDLVTGETVQECIDNLKTLCQKEFTLRRGMGVPGLGWLVSNYSHYRYETQPLQEAFGEDQYLFGRQRAETGTINAKVTVTATSSAGTAIVLANCNRLCSEKLPYQFYRPEKQIGELKT